MDVLILGATGYLGIHAVKACMDRGWKVRAFHRKTSDVSTLKALGCELVEGDLNDEGSLRAAMSGCDAALHNAGHFPVYSLRIAVEARRGVEETRRVMAAAKAAGVGRVVYVGASSTIAVPADGSPGNEDMPYGRERLRSAFFQCKWAMEREALRWAEEEELEVVVVCPSGCFGGYDLKPDAGKLILDVAHGKLPFYFPGRANAIDVRDVAAGQTLALERGVPGRRYIFGNWNMEFKELIDLVAGVCGTKPPRVRFPMGLAVLAAWGTESAGALFKQNHPMIPLHAIDLIRFSGHVDSSRAVRELGLPQTPLTETVREAYEWLRADGRIGARND